MNKTLKLAAVVLLSTMTVFFADAQTVYPSAEGWETATPEEMGYSQEKLNKVKSAISSKTHATGACIIVGGFFLTYLLFFYLILHWLNQVKLL